MALVPPTASPFVLEACCGHRREWSRTRHPQIVQADRLLEVRPHLVHDFTALPFREGVFDSILFDPPHLIRSESWEGSLNGKYAHFGKWDTRREWETALDLANEEFHRVAREGALLHVKIIDGRDRRVTKLADLGRLTLWEQVKIELSPSRVTWSTCQTVRATFRRMARP